MKKKIYWTDRPELEMARNDLGEIIDVLDNTIAFSGNSDLLPCGVKLDYSLDMIEEIVKCRDDIIYFAENYYKAQTPDGFKFITLHDYQREILSDMVENQKYLLMMPRQQGKTLITRIYILWCVLFGRDINYGIAANKEAQAKEVLDGIKLAYMDLPLWMQQGIKKWNAKSMYLENGGVIKISATSSSAFRGMSFAASYKFETRDGKEIRISSGIYVDEVAFIDKNKWEEFRNSVIPTVSSGNYGRIIYTSTPKGMNHFYKLWMEAKGGISGFKHKYVPYWDHPDRDEKWAEEKKKELGSDVAFQQEYGCVMEETNLIILDDIEEKTMTIKELYDYFKTYKGT